ncbi:MAG TPA: TetR/AcrR family transcriptional regulator [Syntrophales bacterium]|jgi:AcrR family transcriptional regulator|nr:TetR/AcrR family transcriptional regulator [Syntrophales bacterium]HPX56472.1 TetR/AcrR family transcriptional regulator [Syntrophales bacterium]HQA83111.1 TetR/AcrR family transcriptional regulator [Syntrophales bacterium]
MNETQKHLIEAADKLLQKTGLTRATTREIARQAGVSEGLLYHYFKDKAELILEVVFHRLRNLHEILENLPFMVGQHTVAENLTRVLERAYDAQYQITPIVCGVFSDHQLRNRTREIILERNLGPRRPIEILAAYLAAEQKQGRIAAGIAPLSAARLLFASSFTGAMIDQFLGGQVGREEKLLEIRETVQIVLRGLNPQEGPPVSPPQSRNQK